jgi:alpha-tubulin suppressor-like RCC1 family protein
VSLTVGDFHTCGLTNAGIAYCWGGNDLGQLGTGTLGGKVPLPTPVIGGLTFTSIRAGRMHTCGTINNGGSAYCWGWDYQAQLGAGATAVGRCSFFFKNEPCSGMPLLVAGNTRYAEVYGSDRASCGRDITGAILCWGMEIGGTDITDCQGGQNPSCTRTPLLQVGGATFPVLGMGNVYRCGQKSDGVIWCWGVDYWGNFGNGQPSAVTDTLVRAAGGKSYAQAAFGRLHVCGLNSDGSVECWGNGYDGQVGAGIGVDRTTPGPIGGGITFASITSSADADTNCGISTAGRAYCWGNGRIGQLGNGTVVSSTDPVLVKLVR